MTQRTDQDIDMCKIETVIEPDRCGGCDMLFSEMFSFPARSRYGHGDLCSDCGRREAFEGDFIVRNLLLRLADRKSRRRK